MTLSPPAPMAQRRTLVTVTTPTISSLLRMIVRGQLALPRPRRPYTWTKSEGRDLLQAMWEGRDIGSLVIAQLHATPTDAAPDHFAIAFGDCRRASRARPHSLVIDGQQRLITLASVCKGLRVEYLSGKRARFRLAFHPLMGIFAVANAKHAGSDWLPDVSVVWSSENGVDDALAAYVAQWNATNHVPLGSYGEQRAKRNLEDLYTLLEGTIAVGEMSSESTPEDWRAQRMASNKGRGAV